MKEELISFETAKLAKEKGFEDSSCIHFYRNSVLKSWYETYGDGLKLLEYEYSASTQSLLQKWLRDEHNLFILVDVTGDYMNHGKLGYFYTIKNTKYYFKSFIRESKLNDTPEESLEKGLQEALGLIKIK